MVKKSFYAVVKGHNPGVYETWKDCQSQTSGYTGAIFRKFNTEEEAKSFILNYEETKPEKNEVEDYNSEVERDLQNNKVVVFTDGSFSGKGTPVSGYGCVIITPKKEVHEISNVVYTKKYITTNNIGPEIFAVLESLKWVLSNEYEHVVIYHDLDLIGKWATGDYKASSTIGKLFLRELNEKYEVALNIEFKWVPAHKGIKYNERADILAKEAVHRKNPVSKYGNNSFMGRGVDKVEVDKIIDKYKNNPSIEHHIIENNEQKDRHVFEYEKEKLTVSYFKTKGTILLQGKVEHLFSEFLSQYTMHLQPFDMIKAYSDSFKHTIQNKDIENTIRSYSLPSDYPNDIITLLKQSHIFTDMRRDEYDYSHYTMPSFRALEGHFKYLAAKEGVIIPLRKNIGSYFTSSSRTEKSTLRTNDSDAEILSESTNSQRFEDIYNYLRFKRNPLFHYGSVNEEGEGSAYLISELSEAHEIIRKTIDFIIQ